MEKIEVMVGNHHQFYGHSNGATHLKFFCTGWIFFNPNPDKVYNMTTSVLQLILIIISGQKLANLLRA